MSHIGLTRRIPTMGRSYTNRLLAFARAYLVAAWPLTEDTNDYSGNGHNGTPTAIVYTGTGPDGQAAAVFNNATSRVGLPLTLDGAFDPDEGTLLVWWWHTAATWSDGTLRVIFHIGEDVSNRIILYKSGANAWEMLLRRGGVTDMGRTTTSAALGGRWNSMVVTWSKTGNVGRTYLNGAQVGLDATLPNNYTGGVSQWHVIGALAHTGGNSWDGMIGRTCLWNRMFTDAECKAIMAV